MTINGIVTAPVADEMPRGTVAAVEAQVDIAITTTGTAATLIVAGTAP